MKRGIIRKTLYVIITLFLLCNFFSLSSVDEGMESRALSTHSEEISITVPHGIHMEIKNEEKNATEVVSVKEKTTKNISLLKYYLLLLSLLSTVYLFSYAYSHRINEQFSYSRLFIINYIHDKDGRKR